MQQYVSEDSESEDPLVTEESSDDWEEASDQTEAEEDDAEEAIELLYTPLYVLMKGGESSSPQCIFEGVEGCGVSLQNPSRRLYKAKPMNRDRLNP